MIIEKGITGKLGSCLECEWEDTNYLHDVNKLGREHTKKTGHIVIIEVTTEYTYRTNIKKAGAKQR